MGQQDDNSYSSKELNKARIVLSLGKDIWNTFGLPTIILVILLLLYTGIMPSPFADAKVIMLSLKTSIDRHLERDNEIIFYMKGICISNARLAERPLEECIWRSNP